MIRTGSDSGRDRTIARDIYEQRFSKLDARKRSAVAVPWLAWVWIAPRPHLSNLAILDFKKLRA